MTIFAKLTLANGATPPVDNDFLTLRRIPATLTQADGVIWSCRSFTPGITSPVGAATISYSLRPPVLPPRNKRGKAPTVTTMPPAYRSNLVITIPLIQVPPGGTLPVLVGSCTASLSLVMPETCSEANRKDLIAMVRNALGASQIATSISNLEGIL